MASLNDQQAGRDFESYDDDRKEGRYDGFAMNAAAYEPTPLSPRAQAACDAAVAQCERAFGRFDRAKGRFVSPEEIRAEAA